MRTIVENFERQELFDHYNSKTNPFSFVTTKIDITKAYNYSRKHKNLYATLCYVFARSINKVPAFLYNVEDGVIVKYDKASPNYTEVLDSGDVAFIGLDLEDTLEEFIEANKRVKEEFKKVQKSISYNSPEYGEVWFSCLPWFKFTGVVPPFDGSVTIPQIIWDKYEIVDNHVYVNAMIMAHHGFVDGSHIGALVKAINEELENLKED